MSNKTTVPSLRFRGFSEPWEEKEFNEIFYYSITNNTLSRAELSYEDGSVYNVHYGDVLIKYGAILDIQCDKIPRIPNKNSSDFKGALLQDGDIIIADTAEDETVGKVCEISNLQDSNVVSGLHTLAFRANDKMALGYLGYYLNSEAYHRQLLPLMQGIKVLSLSKSNIQKTIVRYSGSKNEQKQIAGYFSNLDRLIALEQRKYDKLNTVKKSMLEKMFPQKGAKVPEIRFKGFSEPWEEKNISDVAEICTGGTPSTNNETYWFPKEIPWLASGEIHKKQITYTDDAISIEGMNNSNAKIVPENSVLIALAGQGKTRGTVAINRIPLTTNQSVAAMIFSKQIIPEFILSNLENRYEEIRKMSSSDGSRGGLNKQIVGDINIPYILVAEQKQIGNFFSNLDHLIMSQGRKIEKLRNLKKACLEKMFV